MAGERVPIELSRDVSSLQSLCEINLQDARDIQRRARQSWKDGNKSQATADADVIRQILIGIAGTILENTNSTFSIKENSAQQDSAKRGRVDERAYGFDWENSRGYSD